jgi:hypothetical protein
MELDKDTILMLTLQNYLNITEEETMEVIKSLDQINLNHTNDILTSYKPYLKKHYQTLTKF